MDEKGYIMLLNEKGETIEMTKNYQIPPDAFDYIICREGDVIKAKNGRTGRIEFKGTDVASVIRQTINALSATGGTIYLKNIQLPLNVTYNDNVLIIEDYCGRLRYFSGDTLIGKAWKETVSPHLESISDALYRDASYKRYTVSDYGITRIHDLIYDPVRRCIWGITRSDTNPNYVFRMNRDGTISKVQIGPAGENENRGMSLTWGKGYLWASTLSGANGYASILRINPETMELTRFTVEEECGTGGTGIAFDGKYVYLGINMDGQAKIFVFDPETETFVDTFASNTVEHLYWGLFDGKYVWMAGQTLDEPPTGVLVKVDRTGILAEYDLGGSSSGAEITFDGHYIWYGCNKSNELIRFDPATETATIIKMPRFPRLVEFAGGWLWVVGTESQLIRMDPITLAQEHVHPLPGMTYSHGLTFDGLNIWVGTWQDTCYVFRVPAYPKSVGGTFTIVKDANGESIGVGETKFVDTLGLSTDESITQVPLGTTCKVIALTVQVLTNTLDGNLKIAIRKNGERLSPTFTVSPGQTGTRRIYLAHYDNYFGLEDLLSVEVWADTNVTSGTCTIGKVVVTLFG